MKWDDPDEKFNEYQKKSKNYYNSAIIATNTISDSLLRLKVQWMIAVNKYKYGITTSGIDSLIRQADANKISINDHHTLLKILLTLPLIERYQYYNLPDKMEFKELIRQQEKLQLELDTLTSRN